MRNDSESLAERFSRRTAPFSGSDQVSAVVKLSLFGRKNSKDEPTKAAHPCACVLSCSRQQRPSSAQLLVLSSDFTGDEKVLIVSQEGGDGHLLCNSSTRFTRGLHGATFLPHYPCTVYTALNTF